MTRALGVKEALIVGESQEMAAVALAIEDCAHTDQPVLIEGERGTGRELVARAIHYAGPRRAADFVAVKAAAYPRALDDRDQWQELLSRSGTLRRAQGGTLLLKDVSALPRGPQRQLAKALRKHEKEPGDGAGEAVDVRFIAAADGDLAPAVDACAFDRELYDRLGGRRIRIPPLRRRVADIPRLAATFLRETASEIGRGRMRLVSRAIDRLAAYPWPGNVAELKDVCRQLALRARRATVEAGDVEAVLPQVAERIPLEEMAFEEMVRAKLKTFLRRMEGYPVERLYDDVIARVERPLLGLVLEQTGGNQLRAAEVLGLNRNTLRKKLAELGLAGSQDLQGRRRGRRSGVGR